MNFPNRLQLEEIYREIGFTNVRSFPLIGGVVAVHVGEKRS
ncbi:class I SAM-dependent methyltransferase [Anoxybacter fermentans]